MYLIRFIYHLSVLFFSLSYTKRAERTTALGSFCFIGSRPVCLFEAAGGGRRIGTRREPRANRGRPVCLFEAAGGGRWTGTRRESRANRVNLLPPKRDQ